MERYAIKVSGTTSAETVIGREMYLAEVAALAGTREERSNREVVTKSKDNFLILVIVPKKVS